MSVDFVLAALGVPVVHPKQDADGQSGRDPRRDGKQGQAEQERAQEDQPQLFLNTLGQLTGEIINTTA